MAGAPVPRCGRWRRPRPPRSAAVWRGCGVSKSGCVPWRSSAPAPMATTPAPSSICWRCMMTNDSIEKRPGTNEHVPLIGAVIAGGLASACCIGPLIVVLLGLGSASAFVALEPYRPLLAVLTFALLAWAGWRHWRGRRLCAARRAAQIRSLLLQAKDL
ncbi:MAG: hypothetical protein D6682_06500 [Zetaproteobacteria bacterium]|nr:MAG: hypothetical protein D6682_06500 [Zetaproteobacteria bacterium]